MRSLQRSGSDKFKTRFGSTGLGEASCDLASRLYVLFITLKRDSSYRATGLFVVTNLSAPIIEPRDYLSLIYIVQKQINKSNGNGAVNKRAPQSDLHGQTLTHSLNCDCNKRRFCVRKLMHSQSDRLPAL
jgi:hypothetical protein